MAERFVPVLLVLTIAVAFSLLFVALSRLLGPRRRSDLKETTYECGVPPRSSLEIRFYVRFFLVALLFLLFDLEAVFIYPWVILFRSFVSAGRGGFALAEMGVFLGILLVAYLYVRRKGALDWQ